MSASCRVGGVSREESTRNVTRVRERTEFNLESFGTKGWSLFSPSLLNRLSYLNCVWRGNKLHVVPVNRREEGRTSWRKGEEPEVQIMTRSDGG